MQKQIIVTADGSHTISAGENNITYHSIYGAIQESMHVFIAAGLRPLLPAAQPLHLLEIGLGTGLNVLLSVIESTQQQQPIHYTALEPFPLTTAEAGTLNYTTQLVAPGIEEYFTRIHSVEWNKNSSITPLFTMYKTRQSLLNFASNQSFHLVYFDAFAPAIQPELWTAEIFQRLYNMMYTSALIVTYCSKGEVRRAMETAGFTVEKLPGAKGKREMLRARK